MFFFLRLSRTAQLWSLKENSDVFNQSESSIKLVKMIVEARIVHFTEYSQNHLMDEFIIMMLLNLHDRECQDSIVDLSVDVVYG